MPITDAQIIVNTFAEKFNLRFNGKQYGMQLGQANGLLKHYNKEEIVMCINYLSLFPPKTRIVSLGYLPYILNETLTKAKYYYNSLEPVTKPIINVVDIKNERIESKSMFSKNRRF